MPHTKSLLADKHVVVLINYLRRHHVLTFKEVARRVGKLTILVSTPMEGDRFWQPEWEGLNVVVQKNTTITLSRNAGYEEKNFIHLPWDTVSQLRTLNPDVVLSYEMGVRTLFSSLFRLFNRKVPLVMVGNMSNQIESKRRIMRRGVRRVIRRTVDYCTYNGPSCKTYLKSLGFDESKLFYFPYCYDIDKTFVGTKTFADGISKLLYCGAVSERKAIVEFAKILGQYSDQELARKIQLIVAGDGPLKDELLNLTFRNLSIDYRGQCNSRQLQECYAEADACVFPTRGDEWGLVPIEAWASGVPVLGSNYGQSIETVGKEGINGWFFDVENHDEIRSRIATAMQTPHESLLEMSRASRESVVQFTPEKSAAFLCDAVEAITCSKSLESESSASRPNPVVRTVTQNSKPNIENSIPRRPATLSLDLDNKWSYLKSHDNPAWESFPSYLSSVVPTILSVLDELDLKITFFVVGQDAVIPDNFDAIKMIADHGHEIANHSFHHDTCLQLYSPEQLECEFEMAERAIENLVGQKMKGFRGPGFSLSDQTLKLLNRRGYLYDCTTFPTFLAPMARAYYFMTGSFTKNQKKERQALFGKFMDGFAPNQPYLWKLDNGQLLEIPVTTLPGFRTPVHATYLHYLATFSATAASTYWSSALAMYNFNHMSPSFLLHPLDFIGGDDEAELQFFPGMKENSKTKIQRITSYLDLYRQKFDVVPMKEFAKMALNGDLQSRSIQFARSGMS